ncbi:MAG: aldo/keto reductase [Pseudomonadota bacterium]|nr:aldo/keto reductase [Pseudomonadota bacterium]
MRTVKLKSGATVPVLGLGTWRMGEKKAHRDQEVRALRAGLDLGMTLIDTAEMYGEGEAEKVVAEAIAGRREEVFITSKVYPHNATRQGTLAACERSLKRLATDRIELYLLHWRGSHPLAETVAAFEKLREQGKIGNWGVSNFDVADMEDLLRVGAGSGCAADQVLYHLDERGIEWQLVPFCAKSDIAVMAYCPLGQGSLTGHRSLEPLARKHGVTPAAVALAWLLRSPGMIAIPKSSHPDRVAANAAATTIVLDAEDLAALDRAFPPPRRKSALATS